MTTYVKGSCLALCSSSGIKPLRAHERNTRARSLNQPHLIHTTWRTVCKLGAEGFEASSAVSSLAPDFSEPKFSHRGTGNGRVMPVAPCARRQAGEENHDAGPVLPPGPPSDVRVAAPLQQDTQDPP